MRDCMANRSSARRATRTRSHALRTRETWESRSYRDARSSTSSDGGAGGSGDGDGGALEGRGGGGGGARGAIPGERSEGGKEGVSERAREGGREGMKELKSFEVLHHQFFMFLNVFEVLRIPLPWVYIKSYLNLIFKGFFGFFIKLLN